MADTPLPHLDERIGRVAVDMGMLTVKQVEHIKRYMILGHVNASAENGAFGRSAVDMGMLTPEALSSVEQEERRRRRLISGFEIIERLGSGTIATAYRAVQLAMDRIVALKILHPRLAADPVFVNAYIAEAQAVSRFHHPNIVQGFDAGESNGFIYFAHEFLSGGSIADKLARGGSESQFSENRLIVYLRQTAAALRHAWAVAVHHGDINPGNLLLDGNGVIKLANLGVPRVAGLRGIDWDGAPFIRCGPDYAAPEQLERPELVGDATDMYNLGATFYHISFGVRPFAVADGEDVLRHRKANPVPSFSLKSQEGFSGKYLRLLHDMLEPDPGKRPANPEELSDRLENFYLSAANDDISRLARSVRQVAAPAAKPSMSQRLAGVPAPRGNERKFSLRRRREVEAPPPGIRWLWRGMLAGLAAAAVALLVVL